MDCRKASAVGFRTRLGFNQHDPIMTNEQSVLTKIMNVFSNEIILLLYHILDSRINLYFPEHTIAIEVDEFNHVDRIGDNEREEEIKEYLKCKLIRINPGGDNCDEFIELGKVRNGIDKSKELTEG